MMRTCYGRGIQIGILLLVCSMQAAVLAGPLTPPGPPAPTSITLNEIEPRTPISSLPYTIDQPGSYYLVGNVTGTAGENGITINTGGDVTLDLMGFRLQGSPGSQYAIASTVSLISAVLVIKSGFITNWGSGGVNMTGAADLRDIRVADCGGNGVDVGPHSILRNVRAAGNTGNGIVARRGSLIESSRGIQNGKNGIVAGEDSTLSNILAATNSLNGIVVAGGSSVIGSIATANGLSGYSNVEQILEENLGRTDACCEIVIIGSRSVGNVVHGFSLEGGGLFTRVTSTFNGGSGMVTIIEPLSWEPSHGLRIADSVFSGNGGRGILLQRNAGFSPGIGLPFSLSDTTVNNNGAEGFAFIDAAFDLELTVQVRNSIFKSNAQSGMSWQMDQGSLGLKVQNCTFADNEDKGFVVNDINTPDLSVVVRNSSAINNTSHGFSLTGTNMQMVENTASSNGADGIIIDGTNNILLGNFASENLLAGLHVLSGGNRVDSNTVADNTTGIDIDAAGNTILRNAARGTTQVGFDIVGLNDVAPLESAFTATNPYSNIQF